MKVSSLTITLSILIVISLSMVLIGINQQTLSLTIQNYYLSIIDDIANTISGHYNNITEDLSIFVSILNSESSENQEKINLISMAISHSELIDFVMVYETNGELLDIFLSKDFKLPFIKPDSITIMMKEYLANDGIYIGTPLQFNDQGSFYSFMIIPWKSDNEIIGYLATYYDLGTISTYVKYTSLKRFSSERNIYILNCFNQTIVGIEKSKQEISSQFFNNENFIYEHISSRKNDFAITKVYERNGEKILTSLQLSHIFKIVIGVEESYNKAFFSVIRLKNITIALAILTIFIALILSLFFSKRLTTPLKKLNDLISLITKEKNFGKTIKMKSNDEISDLANSFNQLSVELDNYSKTIRNDTIIKGNLARFLAPHVVDKIITQQKDDCFHNEERMIAVLFADIHNFTTISEVSDPSEVMNILNTFFSECVKIVYEHDGTVDKYIGDCIMVLFNAPYDLENPALAAANSAIKISQFMQKMSLEFNNILIKANLDQISVGIGIAYGKAIVGKLGSDQRVDYTAIGDTVNIGSLLQDFAKGKNEILIDENVFELIKEKISCEFHQKISLKNRTQKSKIYKIID